MRRHYQITEVYSANVFIKTRNSPYQEVERDAISNLELYQPENQEYKIHTVCNCLLSEFDVLRFELTNPNAMRCWEDQFRELPNALSLSDYRRVCSANALIKTRNPPYQDVERVTALNLDPKLTKIYQPQSQENKKYTVRNSSNEEDQLPRASSLWVWA